MGFVKATMTSQELTTREAAIGDVYCFNKNCKGEKWVFLDAHVTTLRSIYGCGKCGAWLLVHKVPFTLQRAKTTKTGETRFFFAKKRASNCLLMFQFIQPNIARKKCSICIWKTKYKNLLRDLYCPTCGNVKCVFNSTNKTSSFYDCKKCEASCHLLNIQFKKQKLILTLLDGDGTCC